MAQDTYRESLFLGLMDFPAMLRFDYYHQTLGEFRYYSGSLEDNYHAMYDLERT
jgi:hypothetical protein